MNTYSFFSIVFDQKVLVSHNESIFNASEVCIICCCVVHDIICTEHVLTQTHIYINSIYVSNIPSIIVIKHEAFVNVKIGNKIAFFFFWEKHFFPAEKTGFFFSKEVKHLYNFELRKYDFFKNYLWS